ncbi:MAG: 23S rRNA (uridine(2552)-2'-O)-methyltransferase RlmE [Gammaproteobacteria bacterium]
MAKTRSSKRWLSEHHNDSYVKRAREEGYRSRAVYKLLEINERDRLLRPGMTVVDLGAAPGGWSQVATRLVGGKGQVIALDILPMEPLPGVDFIEGDFREQAVYDILLTKLAGRPVDLVISDMAPNISGMRAVDQPRSMYLVELAVDFSKEVLREGGGLVTKTFQGAGFQELVRDLHRSYEKVVTRKPQASRARSRETYIVARGFRPDR